MARAKRKKPYDPAKAHDRRSRDLPRNAEVAAIEVDDPLALEPGDMQFICNYTTLHSRTAYEDHPEPERRRYLLRLWLHTGRIGPMPPSYVDRFEDSLIWQQQPRPPIFDLSAVRAELAH